MKHFAFLDIDDTVLYNSSSLNEALLTSLREQGVTDICFFTNMDIKDITYYGRDGAPMSRFEIIQHMEAQGFTIHKVITSADPGYYDKNGKRKPIGSAFNELYLPLMNSVRQKPESMDFVNYSSNHQDIIDYFQNSQRWALASGIVRTRCETSFTQEFTLEGLPNITKINKNNGKEEGTFDSESLKDYLNDPEQIATYAISQGIDSTKHMVIRGAVDTDNKGLMMKQAISELVEQHGQIAITYFDDRKCHINGALQAATPFIDAGLVSLSPCHMSTDYNVSQSAGMRVKYNEAIEQNASLIRRTDHLWFAIENANNRNLSPEDRALCVADVKKYIKYTSSSEMLKLADLAMTGSPIFDNAVSVKTAFKCLQVAYLTANTEEELDAAQVALNTFFKNIPYTAAHASQEQNFEVDDRLQRLKSIACTEITQSSYASGLATRMLSLIDMNLSYLKEGDEGYTAEDNQRKYWEAIINEAKNYSIITKIEHIPNIEQENDYGVASSSVPVMPVCSSSTSSSSISSSSASSSSAPSSSTPSSSISSSSTSSSSGASNSRAPSPRSPSPLSFLPRFWNRITTEVQEIEDDKEELVDNQRLSK